MNKWLRPILLLLVTVGVAAAQSPVDETSRFPNFVLFIADDVSPDFSCFGGQVQTPHIDALAAQGVRFDNAYVTASSCSPSRNSMITGRYPHNTGAPELHMDLPEGQFMFPKALKDAGYYSVLSGKWHMGEATRPALRTGSSFSADARRISPSLCGLLPSMPTARGKPTIRKLRTIPPN